MNTSRSALASAQPRPWAGSLRLTRAFIAVCALCLLGTAAGCDDDQSLGRAPDAAADVISASDGSTDTDVLSPSDAFADAADLGDVGARLDDATPPLDDATTPYAVTGRIYTDERGVAESAYAQRPRADSPPVVAISVSLRAEDAGVTTTTTAADGTFSFTSLTPGRYLVSAAIPAETRCNSNNLSRRVPTAIADGALRILTFGDSLPHYGPQPWFPARVKTLLDPFATITDQNIAVPGSESGDWLKTGRHYQALKQRAAAADLIVFSLGGNDIGNFLEEFTALSPEALFANLDFYLAQLDAKIEEIADNLQEITEDVRVMNPTADIAWVVYVNYAYNDYWAPYLGDFASIVQDILADKLETIRFYMSRVDDLMLIDLYEAIPGEEVAALMIDELHFNSAGHARAAEELFMLLGGVTVDANPALSRGLQRLYGLAAASAD